jgi:hypothetical protein
VIVSSRGNAHPDFGFGGQRALAGDLARATSTELFTGDGDHLDPVLAPMAVEMNLGLRDLDRTSVTNSATGCVE